MRNLIKTTWKEILDDEMNQDYFKNLEKFLESESKEKTIYPPKEEVFNALNFTDYEDVKVVILGQDPYHGENQGNGLAFSVRYDVKIPPSLRNIYKELNSDLGLDIPNHGNLEEWANRGVLLLNTVLTVEKDKANSHRKKGWEKFTDRIIEKLNERDQPIVFILWGKNAWEKEELISNEKHHIIKSFHPSPLAASRGFFGSEPFSKTNEFLKSIGEKEIDWSIKNHD